MEKLYSAEELAALPHEKVVEIALSSQEAAVTDDLTGVPNRRGLRLHSADKEYCSALMLDIDFFGQFNKKHGQAFGDTVLYQFTQTIKDNLRQSDIVFGSESFFARLGGEEFGILLNENKADAITVAQRLLTAVYNLSIQGQKITVSIGVSTDMRPAKKIESLFEAADKALREAKSSGRNRVVHADDIQK